MKWDLKINFYILEEIVYEIQKYSTALEEMERSSSSVISMLEMNESQGIEELEKLYRGFEKELKKCREELQDLRTILASYTNEMQSIIRPNNQQNFMRVDRNDIWFNKEAIIYACDNINDALKDHNLGWDEFSFGKSDEKKAREERNYRKLEDIWEHLIPRFSGKLSAQIDGLDHVYNRKIIPFENKDDEYKSKATRLYNKYTNLWEGIRTDITDDIKMLADLVHGVFDAIIDLVVGIAGLAWGVISYSAAVDVLAVTYPLNIQPKWAEEVFNGTNSVVGSILNDPLLVVEGFAQQASDAFEEEGVAYALGYVAGDFLGGKGLGKLAKVGKAKVLEKSDNIVVDYVTKRVDEASEGTGKGNIGAGDDFAKKGSDTKFFADSKTNGEAWNAYFYEEYGANNVQRLTSDNITLKHQATSGCQLESTIDKTTTVLGNYNLDTKAVIKELSYPKTLDFEARNGYFNVLNTPDCRYETPMQFWEDYNKPWLDKAIERKDIIKVATKPENKYLIRINDFGKYELTGFGREYTYLLKNGYVYDSVTSSMMPK